MIQRWLSWLLHTWWWFPSTHTYTASLLSHVSNANATAAAARMPRNDDAASEITCAAWRQSSSSMDKKRRFDLKQQRWGCVRHCSAATHMPLYIEKALPFLFTSFLAFRDTHTRWRLVVYRYIHTLNDPPLCHGHLASNTIMYSTTPTTTTGDLGWPGFLSMLSSNVCVMIMKMAPLLL